MDKWISNKNGEVTYLTHPVLSAVDGYVHAFSTRPGDVSCEVYKGMTPSSGPRIIDSDVLENYRAFTEALGIPYDSVVMSSQTHTTNVRRIYASDRGHGLTRDKYFFDTDGMITNEPGVALFTYYADCVPLYFIDPVHKAIGLSHSGWRGTVGRMGKATVNMMNEEFGSDPADIITALGPSICAECYEVSEDVALEFIREFPDNADSIAIPQDRYYETHNIDKAPAPGKYQLDLWQANRCVLTDAGILPEHIGMPGFCTRCNNELLFSHRAPHGRRGHNVAVLYIK